MIKLKIEAENASDLRSQLEALLGNYGQENGNWDKIKSATQQIREQREEIPLLSLEQVKIISHYLQTLGNEGREKEGQKVLNKFAASSVKELKHTDYADVYAELSDLLNNQPKEETPAVEEKPKKKRAKKTEAPDGHVPEELPKEEKTEEETPEGEPLKGESKKLTKDDLIEILLEKNRSGKKPQMQALLDKFGVERITKLEENQYADFYAQAQQI